MLMPNVGVHILTICSAINTLVQKIMHNLPQIIIKAGTSLQPKRYIEGTWFRVNTRNRRKILVRNMSDVLSWLSHYWYLVSKNISPVGKVLTLLLTRWNKCDILSKKADILYVFIFKLQWKETKCKKAVESFFCITYINWFWNILILEQIIAQLYTSVFVRTYPMLRKLFKRLLRIFRDNTLRVRVISNWSHTWQRSFFKSMDNFYHANALVE